MPAKTSTEALRAYARPISASLGCITEVRLKFGLAVIDVQSYISLKFIHWYRPYRTHNATTQGSFDIITTAWEYAIHNTAHREILAYHWHPVSLSDNTNPHFHVGSAVIDTTGHEMGKTFSRLHLPSGHVTIAEVVRALIEEFDVLPIHDRWDETLRACQEAFEQQRTNS